MLMKPYGRSGCGLKAMPPERDFSADADRPYAEYTFYAEQGGAYELLVYLAPSNTAGMDHRLCFGLQMNGKNPVEVNCVEPGFAFLSLTCREWDACVRNNIRIKTLTVACRKGVNILRVYAGSPLVVFERFVLYPCGRPLPASYLGPPAIVRT